MKTLYRTCWKSGITGATGKGTGLYPMDEAQRYADELTEKDAPLQIYHWIEPVEVEEENENKTP